MSTHTNGEIRVSAVVMRDADGLVLNVRKRGTNTLMLPGGKPEPGETAAETAVREISEELGIELDPSSLAELGEFRAAAANEAGFDVVANVFEHPFVAGVQIQAEIEQLEWVHPSEQRDDMAPLNTEHVFPALLARG